MRQGRLRAILDEASQQIYDDGAQSADISFTPDGAGEYRIDVKVKYRGEGGA